MPPGTRGPTHPPTPGNHEYNDGARGYKEYFGAIATPQGKTFYSHDIGNWHFVALDSNLPTAETSEQGKWLVEDLKRTTKGCIAAYWHHPFASGASHGDQKVAEPFWRMLYAAGADVVFAGHDHSYERFKPQRWRQPVPGDSQAQHGKGVQQARRDEAADHRFHVRVGAPRAGRIGARLGGPVHLSLTSDRPGLSLNVLLRFRSVDGRALCVAAWINS
ncbi:metallophosphoesterase [Allokutzneria sp. A3M-2-11 16]|nr:metallophosphoesterase [Allokutzneria sp. A3M-2-11 16]